jgi:DNA-binding NtrC family response regulator
MPSHDVMVVSEHLGTQQMLARALGRFGCAPIIVSTVLEATTIIERQPIALIFCSDELLDGGVEDFVQLASQRPYRIPVVVVSRLDDWSRYVHFLQVGAFDYVLYPPNGDEIDRVVRTVLFGGELEKVKHAAAVV